MNNGKTIGLALFIGGIILLFVYGLYLGFEKLMNSMDYIAGFLIGTIIVGFLSLLISIVFEQRADTKETMKDIKKEDLEP